MRILVTGAQGFLGRYVVARWLAADASAEVMGIGRSPALDTFTHPLEPGGALAPLPETIASALAAGASRYRYASVDLLDRPRLIEALTECQPDVIIHLAGVLRGGDPRALISGNVEGTVALIQGAAEAGLSPRIVLGSSGAIYGQPQALPLREDTPQGPTEGLYAISRRASEAAGLSLGRALGIPICLGRIFNPIGPGLEARHLAAHLGGQLAAIEAGARPPVIEVGPLDTTRDFIDARDVADALRHVALRGEAGLAYNLCRGEEVPCQAILDGLLAAAGLTHRVEIQRRPQRPGDTPRHWGDATRLNALGFTPRYALNESLAATWAWHREVAQRGGEGRGHVATGAVRVVDRWRYPVEVRPGLLDDVPQRLKTLGLKTLGMTSAAKVVVLTDTRVEALYGRRLLAGLLGAGLDADLISLPEGEGSKQLTAFESVVARLHAVGFDRRSALICLGGGLITDVGGFVAATYLRGVRYVNVPTTLLAQHDSAIGGKVAVNTPWAKNFIGAFHHPEAVYCDPEVLATLTPRDVSSGVAEAIKVALTGSRALFELLEVNADEIQRRRDPEILAAVVRQAAARKIEALAPDPREHDLRRVLNLGHTLAHALETELAYQGLLHGEAVGYGIALATEVARLSGICPPAVAARIHRLLALYDLPPAISPEHQVAALERLREIRLVRGGHLHFVMPTDVDAVTIVPEVSVTALRQAMARFGVAPR